MDDYPTHTDITNLLKIHNIIWDHVTHPDSHAPRTDVAEPSKFAGDNWDTARGAVKECFRYYGWSPGTLRTSYAFLVLLRLAPRSLIAKHGKALEGPLQDIKKEVKSGDKRNWKDTSEIAYSILTVIQDALANIQATSEGDPLHSEIGATIGEVQAGKRTVRKSPGFSRDNKG